jgi:DNA replication and repair protein RecF
MTTGEATNEFKAYYSRQKIKQIYIDGKPLKKLSDLYQYLQVVYSGPEDIYNFFSIPAKRRHFMDMAIAKIFPVYIDFIRRFNDALDQRNALLKSGFNPKEKEAWDKVFCEEVKNVTEYRIKFFSIYREFIQKAYSMIIGREETVDVFLRPNFAPPYTPQEVKETELMILDAPPPTSPSTSREAYIEKMMKMLKDIEQSEVKTQTSLLGCQRDDFHISINHKNAFHFASQGQKRSIVIAMKIALANMITDINKTKPIMIFDDTLAELDMTRSSNLLSKLTKDHQIFIASPTAERYLTTGLPVLNL